MADDIRQEDTHLIPFPKNRLITDRPEGVNILETNASSLRECQIIVIGEDHGTYDKLNQDGSPNWQWGSSRHTIWRIFELFTHPGDKHLRESYQSGQVYSSYLAADDYHTPQGVTTYGWDNMEFVKKHRKIRYELLPAAKRRALAKGIQFTHDKEIHDLEREEREISRSRDHSLVTTLERFAKDIEPGQKLVVTSGHDHLYGGELSATLARLSEIYKVTMVSAN